MTDQETRAYERSELPDRYVYDAKRKRVRDHATGLYMNVRYMWHVDGRSKARSLNKLWREGVITAKGIAE